MSAVDEMRWTGSNITELRAWAGDTFMAPRNGRPAAVVTSCADGAHGLVELQPGDYVVRHAPDPAHVDVGGDHPMKRGPVYAVRRNDSPK